MKTQKFEVKIKSGVSKTYPVVIGENILEKAESFAEKVSGFTRILVVTNANVYKKYGRNLKLKNAVFLQLPDGEKYKNADSLNMILDRALELKFDRTCAFAAFGGGVIGDITGFAASIYQRGIDFIQIPTTLLAQIDASIGGKTAINKPCGKNLIGTFHQPKLVLSDVKVLDTLDERQFKTGLAEVVKYSFIEKNIDENGTFFEYLEENMSKINDFDKETLAEVILKCAKIKSAVVQKDERESGLRAILNFGHTYAHALEKCSNYEVFTHGEAVAAGMKVALKAGMLSKTISQSYYERGIKLINLARINMPVHRAFTFDEIYEAMKYDKKVKNGKINFVLPVKQGTVKVFDNVDKTVLKKVMENF